MLILERCDACYHVALMHTRRTPVGTYGCEQCQCLAFARDGVVFVDGEQGAPTAGETLVTED